jgi:hypothetical protein
MPWLAPVTIATVFFMIASFAVLSFNLLVAGILDRFQKP